MALVHTQRNCTFRRTTFSYHPVCTFTLTARRVHGTVHTLAKGEVTPNMGIQRSGRDQSAFTTQVTVESRSCQHSRKSWTNALVDQHQRNSDDRSKVRI